jgi:hypothetical protein
LCAKFVRRGPAITALGGSLDAGYARSNFQGEVRSMCAATRPGVEPATSERSLAKPSFVDSEGFLRKSALVVRYGNRPAQVVVNAIDSPVSAVKRP